MHEIEYSFYIKDYKKKYKAYSLYNFKTIPQINKLSKEQQTAIEVVGRILPFRINNYVINELINWDNIPDDPAFILTFPQKNMLKSHHFNTIFSLLKKKNNHELNHAINQIRKQLNPYPADQLKNIPEFHGQKLMGIQHKYRETVLFFPSEGQMCHAFCTFCFRWQQFSGKQDLKFKMKNTKLLIEYLKEHNEVSDVLFTGGDPLTMKAKKLSSYIKPLLELDSVKNIRIGTKVLAYWPYKFITDNDSDEMLRLFEKIRKKGKHLTLMAHFCHPNELQTDAVKTAINRIIRTGANIRTQSPIIRYINDSPEIWSNMWKQQVNLGLIPYYMFVARDTGAHHYFSIPLVKTWQIFRNAYNHVSGISRTVRGPCMSTRFGKIQILGVTEIFGDKVIGLRFIQGKNPDWVQRPFFAQYNDTAVWFDELVPAFYEQNFFFEKRNEKYISQLNLDYRDIA